MLIASSEFTITVHDKAGRTLGTIKRTGVNTGEISVAVWKTPPMPFKGVATVTFGCSVLSFAVIQGRVFAEFAKPRGLHITGGNVW
jgi:hypothetical protein